MRTGPERRPSNLPATTARSPYRAAVDGDRWGPDGPPDEAYSRVSDDRRYLGLHATAEEAVSRLVARCAVTVSPVDVPGRWKSGVRRAALLVPDGPGAPMTVIWTGFGVVVRAGHAYEEGFPVCGCDACDEDPERLADDLAEAIEAVAAGGLVETRRRRRLGADDARVELRRAGGSSTTSGRLTEPDDSRHAIPRGTTSWPPWPPADPPDAADPRRRP